MNGYCTIAGCEKPTLALGYCTKHYSRFKRYGDVNHLRKWPNGTLQKWIDDHKSYAGDECLIWPFSRNANGAPQMSITNPCRLMCEVLNGPEPSKLHHAAHRCGKRHLGCVSPRHLYWATPKENSADKKRHGTQRMGEQVPGSRLTAAQVREIRILAESGTMLIRRIAAKFDITDNHARDIIRRKIWKHVA